MNQPHPTEYRLSPSEIGLLGARGRQAARQDERERADAKARAADSKRHRTGHLSNVPPWRYLADGRTPEEAAVEVAREFGLTCPAEAIGLLWKLRQVAASDAAFRAQAECSSATNDAESIGTLVHRAGASDATHKPTPIRVADRPP